MKSIVAVKFPNGGKGRTRSQGVGLELLAYEIPTKQGPHGYTVRPYTCFLRCRMAGQDGSHHQCLELGRFRDDQLGKLTECTSGVYRRGIGVLGRSVQQLHTVFCNGAASAKLTLDGMEEVMTELGLCVVCGRLCERCNSSSVGKVHPGRRFDMSLSVIGWSFFGDISKTATTCDLIRCIAKTIVPSAGSFEKRVALLRQYETQLVAYRQSTDKIQAASALVLSELEACSKIANRA